MKTGWIITGGRIDQAFAGAFFQRQGSCADCIVSVDKGLEVTKALGLVPDAVVGDFDSVNGELLKEYRKNPAIFINRRRMRPTRNWPFTRLSNWAVNSFLSWGLPGEGWIMSCPISIF